MLRKDRTIYPIQRIQANGQPRWEGSSAERLLQGDIAEGVKYRSPAAYHRSKPEFHVFSPDKFRGHIHQEKDRLKWKAFIDSKSKSTSDDE